MKETFLGPQKWAFVVISGGAACALPFVHRTDSTATARQQAQFDSGSAATAPGASSHAAHAVDHLGLPLPTQQLPAWANADRSPFDDLVGITASKPEQPAPNESLPMQPLRPWISGPADAAPPSAAGSPIPSPDLASRPQAAPQMVSLSAGAASGAAGQRAALPRDRSSPAAANQTALASELDKVSHGRAPAEASPWHDEQGWTSLDAAHKPIPQAVAQSSAARLWPDQRLSSEELDRLTRQEHRELASALVQPPSDATMPGDALLPSMTASPSMTAASARPAAVQLRAGGPAPVPDGSLPSASAIVPLPEPRKKHVIFQPSHGPAPR